MTGEAAAEEAGFPGLGWPIKTSFARYVASLPDGQGALDGAIVASPQWGLVFALIDADGFDRESRSGLLKFGGRMGFRGHFGMLAVDIAEPWLVIDGDAGTLSIDRGGGTRIDIARVAIAWADDGAGEARSLSVQLTAEGSQLFGGTYGEGIELDPFIVRLQ